MCPAPPGSRSGNRVTALRWQAMLRALGYRTQITQHYNGQEADALVALHARRSADSVLAFRSRYPQRPLIVALTGTDLYHDLGRSAAAARSLELADRLILLQPEGRKRLPASQRRKARVIYQSLIAPVRRGRSSPDGFVVCVLGHLRTVKDPFRAALAVRKLPRSSRIRVMHIGGAISARMAERAEAEQKRNSRYTWLGEVPRPAALRRLAAAHLLVHASRMEGGANAVGEAAVLGVAVLASRIDGNVGLLGRGHPGLFRPGDTAGLRDLLLRAERDRHFLDRLIQHSKRIAPLFHPDGERRAWRDLLRELKLAPRGSVSAAR